MTAEFIDARTVVRTDNHFGEAAVDFSVTNENIRRMLQPLIERNIVLVVTGFIGGTEDGLTTTLGRSGSDYTGIDCRRLVPTAKKFGYGRSASRCYDGLLGGNVKGAKSTVRRFQPRSRRNVVFRRQSYPS